MDHKGEWLFWEMTLAPMHMDMLNTKTPPWDCGLIFYLVPSSLRQFYDLLEIFKIGGYCPDTNYLFLGEREDIFNGLMYEGAFKGGLFKYSSHSDTVSTFISRRLCGSGIVQRGNHVYPDLSQAAISRESTACARQP